MSHETIAQLEESIDQLEHTRECLSDQYYNRKCSCGLEHIKEAVLNYKQNIWRENRT